MSDAERAVDLWDRVAGEPSAPAFSGGIMDAWPAWAVDALAICRRESEVIKAVHQYRIARERKRQQPREG